MKDKFRNFMIGRYGVDSLSKFLLGTAVVLLFLAMGFRNNFCNTLACLLVFLCYFRMFSRNCQKRAEENQKFLELRGKASAFLEREKGYLEQRKTHHIYKCPSCRQKIRVPKGKGKICITCPKCHTEFIKNS
nr:hypothetical protein [uncultured Faecalimonas sp.]